MASEILIPEQTAAVTVPAFFAITENDVPATLIVTNLAGVEAVAVLFTVDGPNGATQAAAQDGTAVTLSILDNVKSINSPGRYAVTKSATVGTSGVFLSRRQNV